jgi:hypothetical protein
MKAWRIPPDLWITIEKVINHYATHPLKRDKENMPSEPQKPFGTTFYTPRNILQVAFWKQLHVGWENFLKGRICTEWCTYIKHHLALSNIKKNYQEWATKLILVLWEHIYRVWTFRNTVHHKDNQGRVARYKECALSRRMPIIWPKKDGLRDRLHEFQLTHFNDCDKITNLRYESKRCWANLSELYLEEASLPIRTDIITFRRLSGSRSGIGRLEHVSAL